MTPDRNAENQSNSRPNHKNPHPCGGGWRGCRGDSPPPNLRRRNMFPLPVGSPLKQGKPIDRT